MAQTDAASTLPSLDELRGISREGMLRCLEILGELDKQGIHPPDGYLFAVSKEVTRFRPETPARARRL